MERRLLFGALLIEADSSPSLELYWLPLERQLYFGAALAPNGSCTGSFLELTRLLSGGSFWSCSGSLDRSCSGSFLELIRILLELIRLLLERKLLLEPIRLLLRSLLAPFGAEAPS